VIKDLNNYKELMLEYYIIDTETNGIKSDYHEMTEIGIIRVKDRVQLWSEIKCEYPERSNFEALKITNKTLSDLSRGKTKEQIVEDCNKFFEEDGLTKAHRCIICHNASFDRRFLHSLWKSVGKEFPADLWLDTMSMVRNYAKDNNIVKPKVNLHASCDLLGINKISKAHNAKVDSRNTYLLFDKLANDKKQNYLPLIKTDVHSISSSEEECGLDPDLLDFE
jgi:DNA polymerase III epsilon subunit-like protein